MAEFMAKALADNNHQWIGIFWSTTLSLYDLHAGRILRSDDR